MHEQSVYGIRQQWKIIPIVILCSFMISHLLALIPGMYAGLDNALNDTLFYLTYAVEGKQPVSPYVIHIALNNDSIRALDIPLWKRSFYGQLISFLSRFDVGVIAFDIFFQDARDRFDDDILIQAARKAGNVYFPVIMLTPGYKTIYQQADDETASKVDDHLWKPIVKKKGRPYTGSLLLAPFPELARSARGFGHINHIPDSDGKNRKIPLIYAYKDSYVPTLSLRALFDFLHVEPDTAVIRFGDYLLLPGARMPGRNAKDIRIPIDEKGQCVIRYVGPWFDSFLHFPVHKVLEAETDPHIGNQLYDILENAFIVISDISTRTKDYGAAPYEPVYPLTGIHLNFINMVLTENFVYDQGLPQVLLMGSVCALLMWGAFYRFRWRTGFILSLLGYMIILVIVCLLFFIFRQMIRVIPLSVGFVLSLAGISLCHYYLVQKHRTTLISQYRAKENLYNSLRALDILKDKPVEEIIKRLKEAEKQHTGEFIAEPAENTPPAGVLTPLTQKRSETAIKLEHPEVFSDIVTSDTKICEIFTLIEAFAPSPYPVLITGESGVGKELIARAIYRLSGRPGSFIAENIAGLDDTLFSDTLFGHEKGAYTGAHSARKGLIEKADSGTLFLDEIGDLVSASQVKLLRLLQDGEYRQLGTDQVKRSHARMIFATNKNLTDMVRKGGFRQDLFHRFTYKLHIPPLRERPGDLPLLINHFLEKSSTQLNKKTPTVPEEVVPLLLTYPFPGNVRELETMIENAVRLHTGKVLSLSFFKTYIKENTAHMTLSIREAAGNEKRIQYSGGFPTLDEVEKLFLDEALKKSDGIQTIAAQLLGITPSRLSRKLKKKGNKMDGD
jgi:transcriptional regulator with PAS, ATPase and Fis domain/CHASE2 domain-containing sensor protein